MDGSEENMQRLAWTFYYYGTESLDAWSVGGTKSNELLECFACAFRRAAHWPPDMRPTVILKKV
jgi:hypothetical protein